MGGGGCWGGGGSRYKKRRRGAPGRSVAAQLPARAVLSAGSLLGPFVRLFVHRVGSCFFC